MTQATATLTRRAARSVKRHIRRCGVDVTVFHREVEGDYRVTAMRQGGHVDHGNFPPRNFGNVWEASAYALDAVRAFAGIGGSMVDIYADARFIETISVGVTR